MPQERTALLPAIPIKRILVCQLRQIGDVLLSTPSVELLAQRFPDSEIHFFTEKKCLPMLEGNPHIHTLWPIDKKALPTLLHELAYYRRVTQGGFDLVVDFQQLPRCRWVVAFSRAPIRLSFPPPWYLRPLYTHWQAYTPAYAAAYKAQILQPLGIFWNGEKPRLYLTEKEWQTADNLLENLGIAGTQRFITIDATHRHATRRWPAEHYARLIDLLATHDETLHFLLPYGPGEKDEVCRLKALCACQNRVHVPQDMLSLRTMAAVIGRAAMHLGNCSSPRHIAVALDTPTITILGATSGGWTFPAPMHLHLHSQDACRPCNKNTCTRGITCLAKLTPEDVFPAAAKHLTVFSKK